MLSRFVDAISSLLQAKHVSDDDATVIGITECLAQLAKQSRSEPIDHVYIITVMNKFPRCLEVQKLTCHCISNVAMQGSLY